MTTRKSIVSYPVAATPQEKRRALLDGIRECGAELIENGFTKDAVRELEQVANDIETDPENVL